MDHIEVLDVGAPAATPYDDDDVTFGNARPTETLADWIALAHRPGEVEITPLAWIKPMHGETCPNKSCLFCATDETTVQEFARRCREAYALNLEDFKVEWDPTITF